VSSAYNPFPPGDPDRHELWTTLVERDIEAFARADWGMVAGDFIPEGFMGVDAGGRDRPDAWRLAFPTLEAYRGAWLEQARRMAELAEPDAVRSGLLDATVLRDIEVSDGVAVAHKKFDGAIELRAGGRERLRWQTLYHCRRQGGRWKISGFIGYLPNPMGAHEPDRVAGSSPAKRIPPGAGQHRTAGPYSPVLQVSAGEFVVISGQAALTPDGSVHGDDVATQAHYTLDNCARQLGTAGCGLGDVFKVNVFLTDLANWSDFNDVYAAVMPDPKPVRTAVQTALLPGLLVEVEMWAVKAG
jgi:enamine deaminase RidA (YjgF/YER057c/UK114 family)